MEILLAQSPTIDGAYVLALISRILHILGALVLVGGISYLTKVVVPTVGDSTDPASALYAGRRATWAKWVGIATVLLLVTGIYNLILVVRTYPDLAGTYHIIFAIKFLLALAVFFLAAILAGKTSAADRLRHQPKKWFTVCLVLGIAVVVLGSVLRSFHLPMTSPQATEVTESN